MGIKKTLSIIIVLPSLAWILHLLYHVPMVLKVIFCLDKIGVLGYAYCSLAGLILAVIVACIIGLFALRKRSKIDKIKIMSVLAFWVITLSIYFYVGLFVNFGSNEPIGPSHQGSVTSQAVRQYGKFYLKR